MALSQQPLQAHYRDMHDAELLDLLHGPALTAEAAALLRIELDNRDIDVPYVQHAVAPESEDAKPEVFDLGTRQLILGRYLNIIEARIHCALLQAEGIAATLADEHTAVTDNYVFYAIGGVRLLVPANELHAAQQILAEVRSGRRNIGDEYYDSLPAVHHETAALSREHYLLISLALLVGVALLAAFLILA